MGLRKLGQLISIFRTYQWHMSTHMSDMFGAFFNPVTRVGLP